MMDANNLALCTGARGDRALRFAEPITAAMAEFDINTPARQAAFLAQVGHESGGLHWTTELWGPTAAQRGYEGRKDLGNTQLGDGFRFRGRGLIQTTGRFNYQGTGLALGLDLVANPDLLSEPVPAARSAGWFWKARGLNEVADRGDFLAITKRINGGYNGLSERQMLWAGAKDALGIK
jgi:putative chitinase